MRALIIDDSSDVRRLLGRILKDLGFESLEAEDGTKALETLKRAGKIDVALVDLYMPGMNGHEVVKAIRAVKQYDETRIVMVTTETDLAHVKQALDDGANEYVMKPFSSMIIREKLAILGLVKP